MYRSIVVALALLPAGSAFAPRPHARLGARTLSAQGVAEDDVSYAIGVDSAVSFEEADSSDATVSLDSFESSTESFSGGGGASSDSKTFSTITSSDQLNPAKIYVGNLDYDTGDDELKTVFGAFGEVTAAYHVKDREDNTKSRGYGFVEFTSSEGAAAAIEAMNGNVIEGYTRSLRVTIAGDKRDAGPSPPRASRNADGTQLYIGNLDYSVSDADLLGFFSEFGAISAVHTMDKAMSDGEMPKPKGFGFVAFPDAAAASAAVAALDGVEFNGRTLRVSPAGEKRERAPRAEGGGGGGGFFETAPGCKLYVGNLNFRTESEALAEIFSEFGEVLSASHVSERDDPMRKRGFGFVVFADAAAAAAAVEELDGADVDGRTIRVNLSER